MVTNDERREAAARLRKMTPEWMGLGGWRFYLKPRLGISAIIQVTEGDPRNVSNALADLIEPEPERTCHAITTAKPFSQTHELHVKSCSSCGCVFQAEARRRMPPFYGEVVAGNQVKQPSYCPNCGAKLVE